ncbi:MAG TPA: hypothetical protein PK926_02910 [Spirochaetota bacterium]|nr:hypothetical protein [Spirochaetota bacterium]HPI87969.1 hypothetical protein [Spirochaetota bacterium]HPR46680.1 hypothetical protein [Spirochaetota bacterium]
MATMEHHCLAELLVRHYMDELNARILAVVSNHDILRELAEKFGIPYHRVPHEDKSIVF